MMSVTPLFPCASPLCRVGGVRRAGGHQSAPAPTGLDFNFNFNCFPVGLTPIKETPAVPDITRLVWPQFVSLMTCVTCDLGDLSDLCDL